MPGSFYQEVHRLRDGAVMVYRRGDTKQQVYQARLKVPGVSGYVIRSLKTREFAQAAVSFGASGRRIMFRELLPNAVAPIVVAATLNVAHAILAESYISFLGYGIQPPTPSWGNMLESAQSYLTSAPWLAIIPGLAITLAVTSFNFVGDGLRDALDPRMDGR